VADTLSELLTQVQEQLTLGNLGPVGLALLIWTALALLTTMERSLNRIFEAPRARPLLRRIIIYWALITLTPIVHALVTYLFNTLDEWATGRVSVEWILDIVGVITPIAVTTVLLALFYTLMPNITVRFKSAVAAAFVAVLIWTLSRAGLAIYVQQVAGRNIYGAIGLIPLFMIWMNLSWYIFLFGAQLCCTISHMGQLGWADSMDSETAAPNPWLNLAVMTAIANHFAQQGKPTTLHKLCEMIGYSPITTKPLVQSMIDQGMLCTITSEGIEGLIPTRPLNKLPLADLLDASKNPDSLPAQLSPATRSLLEPVRQKIQAALQRDTLEPTHEPKA
jgi:membrane protein